MAMITIDGVAIKTPQVFTVNIGAQAQRRDDNILGDALIDRKPLKRILDMEWGPLTWAECSTILTAVGNLYFSVVYPDPQTGANRTMIAYVESRVSPVWKYTGSTPSWESLVLSLKER